MEESYRSRLELLGPEHRMTLQGGVDLGIHYANRGELSLAEGIVPLTADIVARVRGGEDQESVRLRSDAKRALAWLRQRQGRAGEARAAFQELLEMEELLRRAKGVTTPYHARCADLLDWIGGSQWSLDRDFDRARETLSRGLEISRQIAGDGYPTQSLLRSLGWIHSEIGKFDTALDYMRQSHEINVRRLGVTHPWTRNSARRMASVAGRLGNWPEVAHELQAQREQGTADALSLSQELLARTLADLTDDLQVFRRELWAAGQKQPIESAQYQTALILLSLTPPDDELAQILSLGQRAESDLGGVFWGEMRKPILQGLAAYRGRQFTETVRILQPIARERINRRVVSLGRYLVAMALHQQERHPEAKVVLNGANELLGRLLLPGDLQLPSVVGPWRQTSRLAWKHA